MLQIQNYASFVLAILIFQAIPGAGTIAILNATARNGIRAGLAAVAGTLLGDFLYMSAAVLGLAALMNAHPLLFKLLQWLGAGYLCWMGLQLIFRPSPDVDAELAARKAPGVYFRQAFAVSVTNPKVVLFFVAFFPLFLRADASPTTLLAMMAHVSILSLAYQTVLVVAGNAVAVRLRGIKLARKIAMRLAGITLVAFGVKLAANNR